MARRLLVSCLMAGAMLVGLAGSALAGGWATTTVDEVPGEVVTGETYSIGYTILQHGQPPAAVDETMIRIESADSGETLTFPGTPTGQEGHYVAEVAFPNAGEWQWEVEQGMFGTQSLGTVTVEEPSSAAGTTLSGGTGVTEIAQIALPVAAALALLFFAVQLRLFVRQRWRRVPAGSGLSESPTAGD